jgi:hypothetical protein
VDFQDPSHFSFSQTWLTPGDLIDMNLGNTLIVGILKREWGAMIVVGEMDLGIYFLTKKKFNTV